MLPGNTTALMGGPPPATKFAMSVPTSAVLGTAFTVTVTALDALNKTVPTYAGTVHITSSDGSATLPADAKLTLGAGTFSVTLRAGGSFTVTATDTVKGSITGTSSGISVPYPATNFLVSMPGSTVQNTWFTVTVTARDQFNNTVPTYAGTVSFTANDYGGSIPGNTGLTNGAGSFSAYFPNIGDSQWIRATDTANSSITGYQYINVTRYIYPGALTLQGSGQWQVPYGFNPNNNYIDCYGGGGGGGGGDYEQWGVGGGGGGGGGFARIYNLGIVAGQVYNFVAGGGGGGGSGEPGIGGGGGGGQTWFGTTGWIWANGGGGGGVGDVDRVGYGGGGGAAGGALVYYGQGGANGNSNFYGASGGAVSAGAYAGGGGGQQGAGGGYWGGGGAGGSAENYYQNGGSGAPGIIYIEWGW